VANPGRLLRINLGCGVRWVDGWSNLDGGGRVKRTWLRAMRSARSIGVPDGVLPTMLRRYPRDVVLWDMQQTPLPYEDGSASIIFSQYSFEYLSTDHTRKVLKDCARILAPGGLIRLCQTDIGAAIDRYLSDSEVTRSEGPTAASLARTWRFLEAVGGEHTKLSVRLLHGGGHQQLFDRASLSWLLTEAGFTDIRFVEMGEGDCPDLERLEATFEPVPMTRVEARLPGGS
jgi:predicted SAM-dependent methyltransferase